MNTITLIGGQIAPGGKKHENVSEIQALDPPGRRRPLDGVCSDTPDSCGDYLSFAS